MADKEQTKSSGEKIEARRRTSRRQSRRQSKRQSVNQGRRQSRRQSRGRSRSPKLSRSRKFGSPGKSPSPEKFLSNLKESTEFLESPIDLRRDDIDSTEVAALQWKNYNVCPLFLKLTNTTRTVVLNGLFPRFYCPTLSGGPLMSPYNFAQLHFHWGENDEIGSEHTVEGESYPLEAHVVLYKNDYENYESARSMDDGVIILAFMFQTTKFSQISALTKHLPKLKDPYAQIPLDTLSLEAFLPPIVNDYVLYFGNMAGKRQHGILWFVCRDTLAVTNQELADFRRINAKAGSPFGHNFREVKRSFDRPIYFVNVPSDKGLKTVLHPLPHSRGQQMSPKKSRGRGRRESRRASKKSSRRQRRASKKK